MSAKLYHTPSEKLEARRAANRRYAARNRGRMREVSREWRAANPDRAYAQTQRWRAAHPEAVAAIYRRRRLRREFGLSEAQYDAMVQAQAGACAICGTVPDYRLEVDHDHATGHIRALLCRLCNRMLGHAKDEPARLASAIRYLEAHS